MTGNNKCLLDISIIIKALKRNAIDGKNLDTLKEICVPLTAAGELFYGAYKSTQMVIHLQETKGFWRNALFFLQTVRLQRFMEKQKPL